MKSKRLNKDINDLINKAPEGISGRLVDENNLKEIIGTVTPNKDSLYYGGSFDVKIKIPDDFPFNPPDCKMITKIYHPNINSENGYICLNILKKDWSSVKTLTQVMLGIQVLLDNPNPDDFLVYDIAEEYVKRNEKFRETAKKWVELYAKK
jgi:ubiquitin-protein ligase